MKTLASIVCVAAVAVTASPVLAQQQGGMAGMDMNGMKGMAMHDMGDMAGMHMMAMTVTAVDARTGLVDGTSEGMALKLHFPPASLSGVVPGDKLTVHMGFSKQ